jgi:hypothetical protein
LESALNSLQNSTNFKILKYLQNIFKQQRRLEETVCERDQGSYIRSDLKWVNQVNYAANKANKVLCMLKKQRSMEEIIYNPC